MDSLGTLRNGQQPDHQLRGEYVEGLLVQRPGGVRGGVDYNPAPDPAELLLRLQNGQG